MTPQTIVVIGAGGMAREIRWLLQEINRVQHRFTFLGYAVTNRENIGSHDSKDEVIGDLEWLQKNRRSIDAIAIGVGTPSDRHRIACQIMSLVPDAEFPALIHPSAILDRETAVVSPGTLVCAGVICTVNVRLEPFSLCNFGCTIGHEARVGQATVINPGANIAGGVSLGDSVLVGTGAQILQYLRVGNGATVGAGAVVTHDVPDGATVVGVPARAMSPASDSHANLLIPAGEN